MHSVSAAAVVSLPAQPRPPVRPPGVLLAVMGEWKLEWPAHPGGPNAQSQYDRRLSVRARAFFFCGALKEHCKDRWRRRSSTAI